MRPVKAESFEDAGCFVRNWDKIGQLRQDLGLEDDVLLSPLHFLAATDEVRRSCSVACWQGDELIGLLYATEHTVRGARTGYAVGGDYAGRGLLLCRPDVETAILTAAIEQMASSGIHSLHLRLLPRNGAKPMPRGMQIHCLDGLIAGDRMMLTPDFDSFLATLGKHTRRNVRHFMRKAHQAGIVFDASLTREEYRAGVDRLNVKTAFCADPLRLARDERLLTLHAGGQRLGLRFADGTLAAILCGFTRGSRFHLLTQLNDAHREDLSLSLVLRGHAIAHLIASGYADLQFMGGAALNLGRFCPPETYRSIFVDKERGIAAAGKELGRRVVVGLKRMEKPVPERLKILCGGRLDEQQLEERTALAHSALIYPRKTVAWQSFAGRAAHAASDSLGGPLQAEPVHRAQNGE